MSELINNREHRKKALKEMILELHDGKPLEEVKPKFEKLFGGVSARELQTWNRKSSWKGCQLKRYNAYAMFMLRYSKVL